jgi:hypothetical protein
MFSNLFMVMHYMLKEDSGNIFVRLNSFEMLLQGFKNLNVYF